MRLVSNAGDILVLQCTEPDLRIGAEYAAVTLPWTFNRMMLNTSSAGQKSRALNIAKGIVGQQMLRRALEDLGIGATVQRKSHRADDLFDFNVCADGVARKLDVKSVNYYTNYNSLGRKPLSPSLIIEDADYPGPDWRHFLPMLIPHTQIGQGKEAYCFAIASSIDFRNDIDTNRIGHALAAFPYGEPMGFLASRKLCLAREAAEKGFYIDVSYSASSLFGMGPISLTIIGEWNGSIKRIPIVIKQGCTVSLIGPFSCLNSFYIDREDIDKLQGRVGIVVTRNDLDTPVRDSVKRDINKVPLEQLAISRNDFCNLMLPTDYTMYVMGWMTKDQFLARCRDYTGWVWPLDRVNKYENQPWAQITESDQSSLTKAGFADCIQNSPKHLAAGWMKTNGNGGGACCYVFPNIGSQGGVKETNLYVLPKDLSTLDTLG